MRAIAFFFAGVLALLATKAQADPRVIGYFNSGNGSFLQQAAGFEYTHYIVSFVLPDPSTNQLGYDAIGTSFYGTTITTSVANGIRAAQAGGKKVMLAFGGATVGTSQYATLNQNIPGLAAQLANFVTNPVAQDGLPLHFDGLDIDWEDTSAFTHPGISGYNGRDFLINLTTELRKPGNLPSSEGWLLSHAPQPPYLSDEFMWSSGGFGGYIDVLNEVQGDVDWINMQYYNNSGFNSAEQAINNYTSIVEGWSGVPGIPDFIGLSPEKLVVGKPVTSGDAGSGYLPVDEFTLDLLGPLVDEYGAEFGGAFGWQLTSDTNGAWGAAVAEAVAVPEPQGVLLAACGIVGAMIFRRRR